MRKPLYTLTGPVVHGKGNGKTVGMPTANLDVSGAQTLPPLGVYAAVVRAGGAVYPGVTNVGLRPSVDAEQRVTVETFILDFSGSLYGQEITLELYDFLRPTRRMESLEAVQRQVALDSERARTLLADV